MGNADRPRALPTWKLLSLVFAVAVILNYAWELAQSPLYSMALAGPALWLHCFVASLADGVIVLLLFVAGWLAFGAREWFVQPGPKGWSLLVAAGVALALAVEWTAVHVLHRWDYAPAMPRAPGLQVGLVPVLQMGLLPPLIFRLAALIVVRHRAERSRLS